MSLQPFVGHSDICENEVNTSADAFIASYFFVYLRVFEAKNTLNSLVLSNCCATNVYNEYGS